MNLSRNLVQSIKFIRNKSVYVTKPHVTSTCQVRNERFVSGSSSNSGNGNDAGNIENGLGHSTILVQSGCDIQELPVIVRRMSVHGPSIPDRDAPTSTVGRVHIARKKETEELILREINNYRHVESIINLLDGIDYDNLSATICLLSLEKILKIETSVLYLKSLEDTEFYQYKLIKSIIVNGDHRCLLNALKLMQLHPHLSKTIELLCDDLLIRAVENKLSFEEVCDCIELFHDCGQAEKCDKFWSVLSEYEKSINPENIDRIYKIIPKLKISRRMVIGLADRKIVDVWWRMKSNTVIEILVALETVNSKFNRTNQVLSRWINTNIHTVSEEELTKILQSFIALDFSNSNIEKSVERYIKAKGIRIKYTGLIDKVLDYCHHFRIRNVCVLDGCSEYFIANANRIELNTIEKLLSTLAYLDYQPLNGLKFWQTIETTLTSNFSKFKSNQILKLMLSCVILERYPVNFVKSIFNPYFLNKMYDENPTEPNISRLRNDLKLFDAALTIECLNYKGPMLPRETSNYVLWQDGRIKRIVNQITNMLSKVAGGPDNFSKFVLISQLPLNEIYIVDVLLHPVGLGNLYFNYDLSNHKMTKSKSIYSAIIVHLPEHYNSSGEYLIGLQLMRVRHLRKLGIKVITLRYDKLSKLKIHPTELEEYLVERMKMALPPILVE